MQSRSSRTPRTSCGRPSPRSRARSRCSKGGAKNDPEARDRFLAHIEQATGRLERLLDALLVLARAQTGEEEPAVSNVPLEPILQQVFEGITPHVGVAMETDSPRGLVVATNPRLLEQLLANLVANAAKHTDSGRQAGHELRGRRGLQ